VPDATNYGRVVKHAVIQLDLSRQTRQFIGFALDLISVQAAVYDSKINASLPQTQAKLAANDVPRKLLGKFVAKLHANVQVTHDLSLRPAGAASLEAAR